MTTDPIHPPPVSEHDASQGVAFLSPDDIAAMMDAATPADVLPPNGHKDDPDQQPLYGVATTEDIEGDTASNCDLAAPPPGMDPETGEVLDTMDTEEGGDEKGDGMGPSLPPPLPAAIPYDMRTVGGQTPPPPVGMQVVGISSDITKTGGGKKRRGDPFGAVLRAAILSDVIGPRIVEILDGGTIDSKAELHRRFTQTYESPVSATEFGNWLDDLGISFKTTLKVSLPDHLRKFAADVDGSLAPVQDRPRRRIPSASPIESPPPSGSGESDQPSIRRLFSQPRDDIYPGMEGCILSSRPVLPQQS